MSSTISLAAFTDSAFIMLVIAACGRALYGNRSSGISSRWKQELTALESSLRDIVSEATIASGTLDKQLLRRQEDLELLLRRIEKAQLSFEDVRNKAPQSTTAEPDRSDRITVIDRRPEKPSADSLAIAAAMQRRDAVDDDLPNPTWSNRGNRTASGSTRQAAPTNQEAPLRQQIEFIKPHEQSREDRELLRSIDPVAMRVAERLLEGGQEIHVVARKLELSVAQVRAIETQRNPHGVASSQPAPATPPATGKHNQRQHSPLFQDDIPWTIDRETALL